MTAPTSTAPSAALGLPAHVLWLGMGIDNRAMLHAAPPAASRPGAPEWWVIGDDLETLASELGDDIDRYGLRLVAASDDWEADLPAEALAVRSPGFPRYGSVCERLSVAGVAITTPVAWWLTRVGRRCRVLGITGTKGKSTAASMARLVCEAAGYDAVLAGNIGEPVWQCLPDPGPGDHVVLEISSYMAADLVDGPDIALVTSLGEDHVSWHGSVEQYHRDKLRVAALAGTTVIDARLTDAIAQAAEAGADVHGVDTANLRWRAAADTLSTREFPSHVGTTLAVVVSAVEQLLFTTVNDEQVLSIAQRYEGLPSRFCTVGDALGARWVDDTLASNPMGAAASVDALHDRPLVLLLGGTDRKVTLEPLDRSIAARTLPTWLIALPDNGAELCEKVGRHRSVRAVQRVGSVAEAVQAAASILRSTKVPSDSRTEGNAAAGPAVLFSPAAPTPQRLGNYATRSKDFIAAIAALGPRDE